MPTASPTPAESFAALLAALAHAVVTRKLLGQLRSALADLIIDRIRFINQRFARLAARVAAGRYRPRRVAAHRRVAARRRPDKLPKTVGWLLKLVPAAIGQHGQLENTFRDPAMLALIAAAPASFSRPLRSLCRMLGVTPPPILARQAPEAPPAASQDAPPQTAPPPERVPERPRQTPPIPMPVLAYACGPPKPA